MHMFDPHRIFTPVNNPGTFLLIALVCTVVFVAIMFALHQLSPVAKKWLTIVCTFLAGLFFALEFFLPPNKVVSGEPQNIITPWIEPVSNYFAYILVWTIMLGVISLMLVHGRRVLRGLPGWHDSLAFFLTFFAIVIVGFWTSLGDKGPEIAKTVYNSLYFGMLVNLDSAVFALLAFYIASAAYRAFRIRTPEAGLLMSAALIVMLGMVDVGMWLTKGIPAHNPWLAFFRIENFSQWILDWINMPAYRAVLIGVSIGSLAMAMRVWLSLERGSFFSQEK